MSENGPGRSWKLLEGSRSFRAVPPTTPRPYPWGASHLGCPGRPRRWGAPRGRNPPPGGNTKTQIWQVSGGKVWEDLGGLGVQVGIPTPLIAPQGPLGHLYNVGEGWGAQHNLSPRPMRHPPSSKPHCSTFRPLFRRCSRSESVRVFSL